MKEKQDELRDSLLITKKALEEEGIFFWLDVGTLLGAIRNGKIIPWDHDIDITTWYYDFPRLSQLTIPKPFELYLSNGHYAIRDYYTKEHFLDIFSNKTIKGYMCKLHFILTDTKYLPKFLRGIVEWVTSRKIMLKFAILLGLYYIERVREKEELFEEFTTINMYGNEFNIPLKYDEYLTNLYGDWRVPDSDWQKAPDDERLIWVRLCKRILGTLKKSPKL